MQMTMYYIQGSIIAGNSDTSMADCQQELGPIIVAGALVGPVGDGG